MEAWCRARSAADRARSDVGATDPLERRSRVRALSAEERELEAAAVDENYFGFFGFCSGVRHRGPLVGTEQQRTRVATGATAFARQAGSRCALLPLPADDPCGTRHHSRWRHHLCAVCWKAEADATNKESLRNGRHLLASLQGSAERGLASPSLFWVPTAGRARTILWTSIGNMTGERCAKIRRSLACETCN